jgi:hypothetical protein
MVDKIIVNTESRITESLWSPGVHTDPDYFFNWEDGVDYFDPKSGIPVTNNGTYSVYLENEAGYAVGTITVDNIRTGGISAPYLLIDYTTADALSTKVSGIKSYTMNYMQGAAKLSNNFEIYENIDMSGKIWTPFGNAASKFTGTLYGNNKTVNNLTVNASTNCAGLIGAMSGKGAKISNLNLTNAVINSGAFQYCGILAGQITGGSTVSDCGAEGTVNGSRHYFGGLAGEVNGGTITRCHTGGTINGSNNSGGITGSLSGGSISECYSEANVYGDYGVGGISGATSSGSAIENCYTIGSVTANADSAGGILGSAENSTVINCYAVGAVEAGDGLSGGIAGYADYNVTIKNCFGLNRSVAGYSYDASRVVGYGYGATLNCYGLTGMPIYGPYGSDNGTDISRADAINKTLNIYSEVSWNFSEIWTFDYSGYTVSSENGEETNLPILKAFQSALQLPHI